MYRSSLSLLEFFLLWSDLRFPEKDMIKTEKGISCLNSCYPVSVSYFTKNKDLGSSYSRILKWVKFDHETVLTGHLPFIPSNSLVFCFFNVPEHALLYLRSCPNRETLITGTVITSHNAANLNLMSSEAAKF